MNLKISLLKFDSEQKRIISSIFIDIGKLFFGGGVVGFFIPGISGKINVVTFVFTLLSSMICFIIGVKIIKRKYYEY